MKIPYIPERYRIPYEAIATYTPIYQSCVDCLKGVQWKESTQSFMQDLLIWASSLSQDLLTGAYQSKGFSHFNISERGKPRDIHSVHISERAVQKSLVHNALRLIIAPKLIYENCATLPDKGTSAALNILKAHLLQHLSKHGRNGGILTMDYHAYYDSIDHNILVGNLDKIIFDKRILNLAIYFINQFTRFDNDPNTKTFKTLSDVTYVNNIITDADEYDLEHYAGVGLGLGSEISQITAVFYTNEIDHYVKEQLRVNKYCKYMDDSYIIHEDIGYLKYCRDVIIEMSKRYRLSFNPNKIVITPFKSNNSFIFLKKHYHFGNNNHIVVEIGNEAITRHRRLIDKHYNLFQNGHITELEAFHNFYGWRQSVIQYDSKIRLVELTDRFIKYYKDYIPQDQMNKLMKICYKYDNPYSYRPLGF